MPDDITRSPAATSTDEADPSILLADALTVASPDTSHLLAYLDDPSALSADERDAVETYLDDSPAHRDHLLALHRFRQMRMARWAPGPQGVATLLSDRLPPAVGKTLDSSSHRWLAAVALGILAGIVIGYLLS